MLSIRVTDDHALAHRCNFIRRQDVRHNSLQRGKVRYTLRYNEYGSWIAKLRCILLTIHEEHTHIDSVYATKICIHDHEQSTAQTQPFIEYGSLTKPGAMTTKQGVAAPAFDTAAVCQRSERICFSSDRAPAEKQRHKATASLEP